MAEHFGQLARAFPCRERGDEIRREGPSSGGEGLR